MVYFVFTVSSDKELVEFFLYFIFVFRWRFFLWWWSFIRWQTYQVCQTSQYRTSRTRKSIKSNRPTTGNFFPWNKWSCSIVSQNPCETLIASDKFTICMRKIWLSDMSSFHRPMGLQVACLYKIIFHSRYVCVCLPLSLCSRCMRIKSPKYWIVSVCSWSCFMTKMLPI